VQEEDEFADIDDDMVRASVGELSTSCTSLTTLGHAFFHEESPQLLSGSAPWKNLGLLTHNCRIGVGT